MNVLPIGHGSVPPATEQANPQPTKAHLNTQTGHNPAAVGGKDGDGDHGVEPGQSHGGVNVRG